MLPTPIRGKLKDFTHLVTGKKSTTNKKKDEKKQTASAPAPAMTDADYVRGYTESLYAGYQPQQEHYAQQDEKALRDTIAAWLRPSYDKAISDRQERTKKYHAELDADAIARGMGASTYVTDVKARQNEDEAADIADYETDYGAQLAKQLVAALEKEKERAYEVERTNAQRNYAAYQNAYETALALFQTQKGKNPGTPTLTTQKLDSLEDCESYVKSLDQTERRALFDGANAKTLHERNQILKTVGAANYLLLQERFLE